MRISTIGLCCVVLAASIGHARGQSINIDIDAPTGAGAGVPSSTFGAAGQPGTWNALPQDFSGTVFPLVDLSGAAINATYSNLGGSGFAFDNAFTTGDDQLLLDDLLDPGTGSHCTIANLEAGVYTVITYAFAPDSVIFRSGVSVNGGPVTPVGGNFTGSYVQGVTHALDLVTVPAGGSITITVNAVVSFGSFNGVQIVKQPAGAPLAFCGTGVVVGPSCPCNTIGAQMGHGCPNSFNSGGAVLTSSGTASIASDTLVLSGSGMPPSATCLYLQGTAPTQPMAFGDGLSCLGGTLTRLVVRTNTGGASVYPIGTEPAISVRGGATVGAELAYQVMYRDAFNFCTSATFNITNGVVVAWAP